jgi:CheY-like chemotaxis protein
MPEIYLRNLMPEGDAGPDQGIALTHFPSLLGRHSDCQHVILDPLISRRHCFFFTQGQEIHVQDLGSSNGTFVNDERLKGGQVLHDGDRLRLANLAYEVQLPRSADQPAVKPGVAVRTTRLLPHPHHVLVVEDNEDAAEALALLLRAWGHEVRVARDGPAALQTAKEYQPDFVLLDLRLPGMDGYQVAQRLRAEGGLGKARLVAITGYEPQKDGRRFADAGIDDLLTKPVDPEALHKALSHPN